MQGHLAQKSYTVRLPILCLSTLLLSAFAWGQVADEVHISPRKDGSTLVSTGKVAPGLPTLSTQVKPLRVEVDLVMVPVTVTDAMTRPVTTLQKRDFVLYEEDKPQEIRYFDVEEAPASIAVLLDVSSSMSDKINIEREAIVKFFSNANPEDEYIAITFSNRPRLLAGPTQSADEIEQRLIAAETGGSTALLDAIYLAEAELRSARYMRRAIVIISDGGDNASRYTLREIKSLVRESDVQIYAIGVFDKFFFHTLEEKLGKEWLSEITDATGGRTVTVDNSAKVPEAAAKISREMRSEYVLGYRPIGARGASTNRWRKIRVQVTSTTGERPLRAHFRKGYLASER